MCLTDNFQLSNELLMNKHMWYGIILVQLVISYCIISQLIKEVTENACGALYELSRVVQQVIKSVCMCMCSLTLYLCA